MASRPVLVSPHTLITANGLYAPIYGGLTYYVIEVHEHSEICCVVHSHRNRKPNNFCTEVCSTEVNLTEVNSKVEYFSNDELFLSSRNVISTV